MPRVNPLDNLGRAVRRFFGGSRRPVVSAKPDVQAPRYDEFDNTVSKGNMVEWSSSSLRNMVEWSSSSLATERVMEQRFVDAPRRVVLRAKLSAQCSPLQSLELVSKQHALAARKRRPGLRGLVKARRYGRKRTKARRISWW